MRAIEYVGRKNQLLQGNHLDKVNTVLPLVVERTKPRLCLDGGPHLAVGADKKLACKLDTVTQVMNNLKQGDFLCKSDDSNGFMHVKLDSVAQPMHGFVFGDLCFRATALPFGLSISPAKFQALNRIAVSAVNAKGGNCYLYLDDRFLHAFYEGGFQEGETLKSAYLLALLMTAFGGFCSLAKSEWAPKQFMEFLGLNIDSRDLSLSVPEDKYYRCLELMQKFYDQRPFDIKLLEKIRGKLTSWLLVCPNMRLFLREQNKVIAECYKTGVFTLTEEMMAKYRVFEELAIWKDLRLVKLKRFWSKEPPVDIKVDINIYSDASNFAAGGSYWSADQKDRLFEDDEYFVFEKEWAKAPIHVKEILALLWTLQAKADKLQNRTVTAWCDNKAVCLCFSHHGGHDLTLSRIMKQMVELCHFHNITLRVEWICTEEQRADEPSRQIRLSESKLRPEWRKILCQYFDPNIDLFASGTNKIRPGIRYGSRLEDPNSVGNGLHYDVKPSDRVFIFCPKPIEKLVLHNVVPKCSSVMMVIQLDSNETPEVNLLKELFDGFITLGNGNKKAILRPAKHLANIDGQESYFTCDLNVKRTRLYFKGCGKDIIFKIRESYVKAEFAGTHKYAFRWLRFLQLRKTLARGFLPKVTWF